MLRRTPIARPVHLRWRTVAVVFAGGTVGTAARGLLALSVPPVAGVAVVTVGINVLGAFLLGLLLETLTRSGPDEGGRRSLRFLLGTGLLGGFTTYSALATDTSRLLADHRPGIALLYALGTLILGACAAAGGIAAGAAAHRRPSPRFGRELAP